MRLLGAASPVTVPETESLSNLEARRVLDGYLSQAATAPGWGEIKPGSHETGRAILEAVEEQQIAVVHAALEWMTRDRTLFSDGRSFRRWQAVRGLLNQLLARHLSLTREDLERMLALLVSALQRHPHGSRSLVSGYASYFPVRRLLHQVELFTAREALSSRIESLLEQLRPDRLGESSNAEDHATADRIDALLGRKPTTQNDALFAPSESWADAARSDVKAMDSSAQDTWQALLRHARDSDSSRPTQKWLKQADALLLPIGEERFKRQVIPWFAGATASTGATLSDQNSALLKGLVWCCSLCSEEALSRALGSLGQACFRKIPGVGPRSERVGNACVYALGVMPGTEPVAQLARLRIRVKYHAGQEAIRKALEAASQRAGLASEELEELTVPTYGLSDRGELSEAVGDYTAEITLTGTWQVEWTWRARDGRTQKTVPAEVRQQHGEELKALKQTIADMEKMLPAQRERVEALLRAERSWTLPEWRERYQDHPLLAALTRRLIWHFQLGDRTALGIWHEGWIVNPSDRPLDWLTDETRVRLWHPIGFEPEVVLAWRTWLDEHSVTQPFKQAHREIYVLTDAELSTATYSNRFASHLLKQHQLKALCDQKCWRYRLQGGFDSGCEPQASLALPGWDLYAQFWVDPVGREPGDFSASGINLYVSTDQVRFCGPDGQPRPLTEVPALVFSEVMRDVDLFVGVASVGNDPNWQDSGGAVGYGDYWQSYAFGDLSETANTRREVLRLLLPKLKIATRCSFDGRFLVVRGDLRTYKIHLGSSNILMEPNDQYLCIVPDRGTPAKVSAGPIFLPFEGDRTLSLILSKAFLLAEDTKIKDPTIVSQIRRR
jgi:hypothetical protein